MNSNLLSFTTSSSTSSTPVKARASIQQVHLCASDFQKSLELSAFNRTLFVYEVEWRSNRQLDILLMVVESVQYPLVFIGDLTPHFNQIYSMQCIYQSKTTRATFRHLNMHEYDRTVIVECEGQSIDETKSTSLTLQLTEIATKKTIAIDIHLCWSSHHRVNIGHCHKALFTNIPFYLIEQWLDFHIYIGVERFLIYDRVLQYQSLLKPYIDRGYVEYVPYPLLKEIVNRDKFNWIDQFVGKMHCLMRTRASFNWLGTWDFDEYLHFFTGRSQVFLPNCSSPGNCTSMLSIYLKQNFQNYKNVVLYAVNFYGDGNISAELVRNKDTIIVEQYQYRSSLWNDRLKYIVQPNGIKFINIHFAMPNEGELSYQTKSSSPNTVTITDPRSLLRLNHYASALYVRDHAFLALQSGSNRTVHDPLMWKIFSRLRAMARNRTESQRFI